MAIGKRFAGANLRMPRSLKSEQTIGNPLQRSGRNVSTLRILLLALGRCLSMGLTASYHLPHTVPLLSLFGQLGLGHINGGNAPEPIGLALGVEELHLLADLLRLGELGKGQHRLSRARSSRPPPPNMSGQSRKRLDLARQLADESFVVQQLALVVVKCVADSRPETIEEIEQRDPHLDLLGGGVEFDGDAIEWLGVDTHGRRPDRTSVERTAHSFVPSIGSIQHLTLWPCACQYSAMRAARRCAAGRVKRWRSSLRESPERRCARLWGCAEPEVGLLTGCLSCCQSLPFGSFAATPIRFGVVVISA